MAPNKHSTSLLLLLAFWCTLELWKCREECRTVLFPIICPIILKISVKQFVIILSRKKLGRMRQHFQETHTTTGLYRANTNITVLSIKDKVVWLLYLVEYTGVVNLTASSLSEVIIISAAARSAAPSINIFIEPVQVPLGSLTPHELASS